MNSSVGKKTAGMGHHVVVNLFGCKAEILKKVEPVKAKLNEVVSESRLNKIGETWYQFKPHGVTGVILLSESHISIHTWPEKGSAAVDIFCCAGKPTAEKAYNILIEKFKPETHHKKFVKR